ncbi:hypothetical protein HYH03_017574 [Edaphochlamys debaryana]|uniref:Protein kinase domain-containing protein n=1 Tax=Edaphochlamys debaryana TaxID=47281 RepID=A0A836BP60_9CHLO|nr:hypothetical protein HYH03_017574 [Edaphochlamys debaryana]|eukprot:KAG2483567.1 hypothetical protein HYH03_017574 [Edaphochlamys debaryana]
MVEFDCSYGFVTCWNATTLVCVTPAALGRPPTVFISAPIRADSIQPYTLLRALAWKQHQALLRAFEQPSASPVLHGGVQQGGDEGAGGGGRGQAGDGGSGRGGGRRGGGSRSRTDGGRGGGGDGGFEASQASGGPNPSPEVRKRGQAALAGTLLLRDSASPEPAGAPGCISTTGGQVAGRVAGQPAPQPAAAPEQGTVQLEFRDVVAQGRDGTVFGGLCDGVPAFIKVYTWEEPQLAAYWCEVLTYRALARLQGSLVPEVLAHGQLSEAMRFLAMRAVPHSRTLSDWQEALPPAVKAAALRALDDAHAACAGFVHGDVRPENILVLGSGLAEGGGSGPDLPRCMLLDLGSSRLDGTPQEQAEERRELEALLAEPSR